MNLGQSRLQQVAHELVSELSPTQLKSLADVILNHQIVESWPWYQAVLTRFLVGPDAPTLIREIEELYPDESALKAIESSADAPIFEAKMVLRESQELARKALARN
jgi:hypothetical protein